LRYAQTILSLLWLSYDGDAESISSGKVWTNFFQFWEELEGIVLDAVLQGTNSSLDTALVSYANNEPVVRVGCECCISTLELALVFRMLKILLSA